MPKKDSKIHPKPILGLGINGKIWPYRELKSKLSKSYASWTAITNDMKFVLCSFNLLKQLLNIEKPKPNTNYHISQQNENPRSNDVLIKALFRSAIVTYAKAFTSSKGRDIKLNESMFRTNKHKQLHNELFSERNNYHAHAGVSASEYIMPVIATDPDKTNKPRLSVISYSKITDKQGKIDEYIKLVKYVIKHTESKTEECGDKLYADEVQRSR